MHTLFLNGLEGHGGTYTQTLQPLKTASLRRTINGALVDVAPPGFDKYVSVVSASDVALTRLVPYSVGEALEVHCLQRVTEFFEGPKMRLKRRPDFKTCCFFEAANPKKMFQLKEINHETWEVLRPHGVQENAALYVSYCPILTMCVMAFKYGHEKGSGTLTWHLSLEEI